ncbi:Subtilisin-like protease SBT2.4 [Senna tora]|uniref:Subtilisin-like protease SBT2.4 n=1 Tax=Senna tora TaxID=362788 RepID=A0A834W628_9FABA|nr:Subtilisin-like protease SBT2.4 [Senna tora]
MYSGVLGNLPSILTASFANTNLCRIDPFLKPGPVLSVVEAATPILHGLNDTTVEAAGPLFPEASTTNTPAFRANNKLVSNTLSNVTVSSGASSGPTERLKMSTPSATPCN